MSKYPWIALSVVPLASIIADDNTITIPEGKLINHPSLYQDITPSAGPRVIGGVGLYFTGDYIYWTAREDNLSYAVNGSSMINDSTGGVLITPTHKGREHQIRFTYNSGFKAGMGFSFGHDKWDMYMNYTWYQSNNNHASFTRKNSDPLANTVALSNTNTLFVLLDKAKAHWDLHFNVFDMEMGRNFYVSKFLSLRPFFGLKGTWQEQHYKLRYDLASGVKINSHQENACWGMGLRSGVNTAWHLAANWSFYADGAITALWEDFSITRKDRVSETDTLYYDTKYFFHTIKPVIELAAGLRKEDWIYNDRYHIALQVGWEEQIWINQNQFDYYVENRQGDLILQGVTAKARFDF